MIDPLLGRQRDYEKDGWPSVRKGGATGRVGYFGLTRRDAKGQPKMHKGVDLLCPIGTAVHATHDGRVTVASEVTGYGLAIYLRGEGTLMTRYAHLSKVLCAVGQYVKKGDRIAESGDSGNAKGEQPHLHFEVRLNGEPIDPLDEFREDEDDA